MPATVVPLPATDAITTPATIVRMSAAATLQAPLWELGGVQREHQRRRRSGRSRPRAGDRPAQRRPRRRTWHRARGAAFRSAAASPSPRFIRHSQSGLLRIPQVARARLARGNEESRSPRGHSGALIEKEQSAPGERSGMSPKRFASLCWREASPISCCVRAVGSHGRMETRAPMGRRRTFPVSCCARAAGSLGRMKSRQLMAAGELLSRQCESAA